MLSARNVAQNVFRSGWYEAEDVLLECDDVDLILLEPPRLAVASRLEWRLRRRLTVDPIRKRTLVDPGVRPVRLAREYDLLVLLCPILADTFVVNAVRDLKRHCNTSVCWIAELWAHTLPEHRSWLPLLREFDHVVVGMSGSVDGASEVIGSRCHYVPQAVDAIRFNPHPTCPTRVVDVFSVGRRVGSLHESLLGLAARTKMFYVYDTIRNAANAQAQNYREHRDLYANLAKRSRFFMVAPASIGDPVRTGGQVEIGPRYYEGAAAGAVLVGQACDSGVFKAMFDWPDAVIAVKADGSDVGFALEELSQSPERMSSISRRNMAETVLRHDWVYRWKQVLAIAGLPVSPGMEAREGRLRQLAERHDCT